MSGIPQETRTTARSVTARALVVLGLHLKEMGLLIPVYVRMPENVMPFLLRPHVDYELSARLSEPTMSGKGSHR